MEDPLEPLAQLLRRSTYILAVAGAGLSASSGIPTFRGIARWRGHSHDDLASAAGFQINPLTVWQYHDSFRRTALRAQPNAGHYALAKLSNAKPYFLTITQNIDDLSRRAGHDLSRLVAPHGSISTVVCSDRSCKYMSQVPDSMGSLTLPIGADTQHALQDPVLDQVPLCPTCLTKPLRPGIVWSGEMLAPGTYDRIQEWLDLVPWVDLLLVIGTSGQLHGHIIQDARDRGASVIHFDKAENEELVELEDWFIRGDAAETLPRLIDMALAV